MVLDMYIRCAQYKASYTHAGIVSIDSALYPHYINSEFIVGSNYNYVANEQNLVKYCTQHM